MEQGKKDTEEEMELGKHRYKYNCLIMPSILLKLKPWCDTYS